MDTGNTSQIHSITRVCIHKIRDPDLHANLSGSIDAFDHVVDSMVMHACEEPHGIVCSLGAAVAKDLTALLRVSS
jgi:hypothetical protein